MLLIKPSEVDLVIYHGKCPDGFTSALAAYNYFKNTNGLNDMGNLVEYFPASFNQAPPDVTNKNVLICDFSYKKNILLNMISQAKKLAVIDHHLSAEIELSDISDDYKVFDMNHSGAYLTWKFFYPDNDVPLFVKYIEDNDIWIKKLPFTEEITCYNHSMPFEFEEYIKMLDDSYIENVAKPIGIGMKTQNDIHIKNALNYCTQSFVKIDNDYYIVAYINSTILKSEVGNKALSKYPYCDFSAIYSIDDDFTTISLRSCNDKTNVSQIATKFGGGGHRNASGISVYNSYRLPVYHIDNGATSKLLESNFIEIYYDSTILKVNPGSINPKILGKYLMQQVVVAVQEKDKDKDKQTLQKCCSIMRTKLNDNTFYKVFQVLVMESPIFGSTKLEYNIFCENKQITKNVGSLFDHIKDFVMFESENRMKFTLADVNVNVYHTIYKTQL